MILLILILTMWYFAFLGYKRPGLALIISPIATALLAVVLLFLNYFEPVLMTPFIFFATLIAILMAKNEPDSALLPKRIAKGIFICSCVLIVSVVGFVHCAYNFYCFYRFYYKLCGYITLCDSSLCCFYNWFEYAAEPAISDGAGNSGKRPKRQPGKNPAKNT